MTAKVVSLGGRQPKHGNWSNEELAEFYRVEHALVQAGIVLETGCGLTDEGDPWFVFCRAHGEVLVHITRYDGLYRLYSPAFPEPLIGPSLAGLSKSFVSGLRAPVQQSASVLIHPAALLSVVVAAIFYAFDFHFNVAHAATEAADAEHEGYSPHVLSDVPSGDVLNQTLVGSLTAFCTRTSEAVSAVLAKVEAAAILVASAVAVFAEHAYTHSVDYDADNAAVIAAAGHNHQPTDQHSGADDLAGQEQAPAKASGLAPPDQAGISTGLAALAEETVQALASVAAIAANQENVGSDKTATFSAPSSPAQAPYSAETGAAQPDGSTLAAVTDQSAVAAVIASLHDDGPAGGAPVITAGGNDPDSGEHGVVNLTLTDGDAASVSGAPNVDTLNVTLVGGGGSIDLSSAAAISTINVTGDGNLLITGIASLASPEIVIAANDILSLTFGAEAADAAPVIKLLGQDQLSLADAPKMPLTLDSEGDVSNTVVIAGTAASGNTPLDLTIVGTQDLLLQESAAAFANTQIHTTAYSGNLTMGLDLENTNQSVDLSQVNATTFIVSDGNVALLQAESGTDIQLGSDFSTVEVLVPTATSTSPAALSFDLSGGSAQPAADLIQLLEPLYTSEVLINSGETGATGVNTIVTLLDPSLTLLMLTGASPLTIGALDGPAIGNDQSITIDAHELSGALNLNVSDVTEAAAGGGSITIIGGSGWNVLTNLTATVSTTFVLGPGENTVTVGAGSVSDIIDGLTDSTGIVVGSSAAYTDINIDELNAGQNQASINAQTSLIAAAEAASGLAGSSVAHQALLFAYQGVDYVFIDVSGNHVFNPVQDAIIKLVGISNISDLAGIFHSA